ncbi:TPA: peptidase C69 [bacterium]|nr:peptidase C69 [bacterium]
MEEVVKNTIDFAKLKGASYADCRIVERREEDVSVVDGRVSLSSKEDLGIGVRVIVDGSWGFASSSRIDEVENVVLDAISIAKASCLVKKEDIIFSEEDTIVASYKTQHKINPFDVSLEKKVGMLLVCDSLMSKNPKIKRKEGSIYSFFEKKFFANSNGSFITQEIIYCGGGITCNAVEKNEVQTRSYPNNFGGDFQTSGFEFIEKLDLPGNAERIADEAVELLSSEKCPSGNWTIILDEAQLALQLHESIGHPIELDRVLGEEAAYAGESFLTLDKLNNFKFGSPIVNVYQDATIPGGLGTFGYDDEGVPAQRTPIIKDGIFVGYLTSRKTAPVIGKKSNGCMRADGWNRIPLIRMTNINLEPGNLGFDELIAGTDDGFFLETNKCWSIDNKRLNFQFATERAIRIKNGKFCGVYKNPVYTGITPEFWASCDAICNKDYWHIYGLPNCGKGQPAQRMFVGHGVSPARFRNVRML